MLSLPRDSIICFSPFRNMFRRTSYSYLVGHILVKRLCAPDGTWYHLFRQIQLALEVHQSHLVRVVCRSLPPFQFRLTPRLYKINRSSRGPLYFLSWDLCSLQVFWWTTVEYSILRMYQLTNRPAVILPVDFHALQLGAKCLQVQPQGSKLSLWRTLFVLPNDSRRRQYKILRIILLADHVTWSLFQPWRLHVIFDFYCLIVLLICIREMSLFVRTFQLILTESNGRLCSEHTSRIHVGISLTAAFPC